MYRKILSLSRDVDFPDETKLGMSMCTRDAISPLMNSSCGLLLGDTGGSESMMSVFSNEFGLNTDPLFGRRRALTASTISLNTHQESKPMGEII
jgi:hypothetical protein